VPLIEASDRLILRLRDAIRPIYWPVYGPAHDGDWMEAEDLVLGYVAADGQAYAYPIRILNFHEIVHDTLAGEPVLISYCPLCASERVFNRWLGDLTLVFGNTSALHQSDMVIFDHQTGSYWFQVAGAGVGGELAGERLQVLPSTRATWDDWKALHPDTLVLLPEAGGYQLRVYQRDVFAGYQERINQGNFTFPISEDARSDLSLNPGDHVLAIGTGGQPRAYPPGRWSTTGPHLYRRRPARGGAGGTRPFCRRFPGQYRQLSAHLYHRPR
jgi:hypothetical protein